jgi:hypothetical protein
MRRNLLAGARVSAVAVVLRLWSLVVVLGEPMWEQLRICMDT